MKRLAIILAFLISLKVTGQIPPGYYDGAAGLSGLTLKTALYNIIKNHTAITYDALYGSYLTTDNLPGNIVWDMYSLKANGTATYYYTNASSSSDQCGQYNSEGDCYNREHSTPASWFNDASPMYSDLFNVYPTDGYVNNKRSNYPMAKVGSTDWTSSNGSKLGTCSTPGYSGTVFEPIDSFKGDFARTFLYMATRYENIVASWPSNSTQCAAVYAGNSGKVFKPWYISLLLAWCALDPVSTKEINRNNAVYAIQNNRNPYIDHPEWIDYIWGPSAAIDESPSYANLYNIYPNPSSEYINISTMKSEFPILDIQIFNIQGQPIASRSYNGTSDNTYTFSLTGIAGGLYVIKIISKNSAVCKPIIIQKS